MIKTRDMYESWICGCYLYDGLVTSHLSQKNFSKISDKNSDGGCVGSTSRKRCRKPVVHHKSVMTKIVLLASPHHSLLESCALIGRWRDAGNLNYRLSYL